MDALRELLKGNTPSLVLAVLREGPLHGYAIAREIERRSGKALRCNEGTLYPTLHDLEQQGLLEGEWGTGQGGRPRKSYKLTAAGHAALAERTRTWRDFSSAMDSVLAGEANG